MNLLATLILTVAIAQIYALPTVDQNVQCENIKPTLCDSILQYNSTIFPNVFGHISQDDAIYNITMYGPLFETNCAKELDFLFCASYFPKCDASGNLILPCRHICEDVIERCEDAFSMNSFVWPACERYPEQGQFAQCLPYMEEEQSDIADLMQDNIEKAKEIGTSNKNNNIQETKLDTAIPKQNETALVEAEEESWSSIAIIDGIFDDIKEIGEEIIGGIVDIEGSGEVSNEEVNYEYYEYSSEESDELDSSLENSVSDSSLESREFSSEESESSSASSSSEESKEDFAAGFDCRDDKVYRFQISNDYGPYEYLDIESGEIRGFNIDLINAVCAQANKTCFTVFDDTNNCWQSNEYPGQGLMSGWYDGCMGYSISPERQASFEFSLPYIRQTPANLYYHVDRLEDIPNTMDVRNQTIGFIAGWPLGKTCFKRQITFIGAAMEEFHSKLYSSYYQLATALRMNEVDAILSTESYKLPDMVQVLHDPFNCTSGGLAMMAQKGDSVLQWWNKAFIQLRNTGRYQALCEKAAEDHGARGEINCI